jgi:hypothetical protein
MDSAHVTLSEMDRVPWLAEGLACLGVQLLQMKQASEAARNDLEGDFAVLHSV